MQARRATGGRYRMGCMMKFFEAGLEFRNFWALGEPTRQQRFANRLPLFFTGTRNRDWNVPLLHLFATLILTAPINEIGETGTKVILVAEP